MVFKVKNTGNEVTEFYLYGKDGLRIVGEIENVGPGLSRDLVVRAAPGDYVTACKPGMKGQGIRDDFTVTDSGKDTKIEGVDQETIDAATTQYAAYVKDQTQQLVDADDGVHHAVQERRGRQGPRAVPARPSATGSAWRPWRSPSVTSTRGWTSARPTSRRARSGPAGTGSRRTCGPRPVATRR